MGKYGVEGKQVFLEHPPVISVNVLYCEGNLDSAAWIYKLLLSLLLSLSRETTVFTTIP